MITITYERTEVGGKAANQDNFAHFIEGDTVFAVVADGVGGSQKGELASEIAVNEAQSFFKKRHEYNDHQAFLNDYVHACNQKIAELRKSEGVKSATTIIALYLHESKAVTVHAGDCRAYQFNDERCIQHTQDHSYAYVKFLKGEITEDEIATHPMQNQLLNCIEGNNDLDPEFTVFDISQGQQFILCSDGFWEVFTQQQMIDLFQLDNPDSIFERIFFDHLKENPKHDNATVMLIRSDVPVPTVSVAANQTQSPVGKKQPSMDEKAPKTTTTEMQNNDVTGTAKTSSLFIWLALLAVFVVACIAYVSMKDETYRLTIKTLPVDATISMLEHPSAPGQYRPAMALSPGTYRLKISAEGFEDWVDTIEIHDQDVIQTISLTKRQPDSVMDTSVNATSYRLEIKTVPVNARISMPGVKEGYISGILLQPGNYQVKVTAPGFKDWLGQVEILDKDVVKEIELETIEFEPGLMEPDEDRQEIPMLKDTVDDKPMQQTMSGEDVSNDDETVELNDNGDNVEFETGLQGHETTVTIDPNKPVSNQVEEQLRKNGELGKNDTLKKASEDTVNDVRIIKIQQNYKGVPIRHAVTVATHRASEAEVNLQLKTKVLDVIDVKPKKTAEECLAIYNASLANKISDIKLADAAKTASLWIDAKHEKLVWLVLGKQSSGISAEWLFHAVDCALLEEDVLIRQQ